MCASAPTDSSIQALIELHLTLKEAAMSIVTLLLIVLIIMLIGAIPTWPHSRGWGYGPSGGLGLVFVVLLILLLMGRI